MKYKLIKQFDIVTQIQEAIEAGLKTIQVFCVNMRKRTTVEYYKVARLAVAYDKVSTVRRVNIHYCYPSLPSGCLQIYLVLLKITVPLTIIFCKSSSNAKISWIMRRGNIILHLSQICYYCFPINISFL